MKRIAWLLFLPLVSCSDPTDPPMLQECISWETCPAGIVVTTKIEPEAFVAHLGHQLVPGDSFIVRTTFENRTTLPTDSVWVYRYATTVTGWSTPDWKELQPGEKRVLVDTLVVTGFTFGARPKLYTQLLKRAGYQNLPLSLRGDSIFNLAPSGYELRTVVIPPQVQINHDGHYHVGPRVRHKTTFSMLVEVANPYAIDLKPIHVGTCVWDYDHCFMDAQSADSTPVLKPGASAYVEMSFLLDTKGHYYDWWSQGAFTFSLCGEDSFSGHQCSSYGLLILANFDADCRVQPITVGAVVSDNDPECGFYHDGSAYRFAAKKGERYHVSRLSGNGEVFLSGPDGVFELDPRSPDMLIPADGTYYVVILHAGPVSFRLDAA